MTNKKQAPHADAPQPCICSHEMERGNCPVHGWPATSRPAPAPGLREATETLIALLELDEEADIRGTGVWHAISRARAALTAPVPPQPTQRTFSPGAMVYFKAIDEWCCTSDSPCPEHARAAAPAVEEGEMSTLEEYRAGYARLAARLISLEADGYKPAVEDAPRELRKRIADVLWEADESTIKNRYLYEKFLRYADALIAKGLAGEDAPRCPVHGTKHCGCGEDATPRTPLPLTESQVEHAWKEARRQCSPFDHPKAFVRKLTESLNARAALAASTTQDRGIGERGRRMRNILRFSKWMVLVVVLAGCGHREPTIRITKKDWNENLARERQAGREEAFNERLGVTVTNDGATLNSVTSTFDGAPSFVVKPGQAFIFQTNDGRLWHSQLVLDSSRPTKRPAKKKRPVKCGDMTPTGMIPCPAKENSGQAAHPGTTDKPVVTVQRAERADAPAKPYFLTDDQYREWKSKGCPYLAPGGAYYHECDAPPSDLGEQGFPK